MCVTELVPQSSLEAKFPPSSFLFPGADIYLCLGPDRSEHYRGNMEDPRKRSTEPSQALLW